MATMCDVSKGRFLRRGSELGGLPGVIRSARPRSPALPLPLSTFPFPLTSAFESAMTMSPFDMLRERVGESLDWVEGSALVR